MNSEKAGEGYDFEGSGKGFRGCEMFLKDRCTKASLSRNRWFSEERRYLYNFALVLLSKEGGKFYGNT